MKRIIIIIILFFVGWSSGFTQSSIWDNTGFSSGVNRNAEAVADENGGGTTPNECEDEADCPCDMGNCPIGDGADVLLVIAASTLLLKAVHRRRNKLRIIS